MESMKRLTQVTKEVLQRNNMYMIFRFYCIDLKQRIHRYLNYLLSRSSYVKENGIASLPVVPQDVVLTQAQEGDEINIKASGRILARKKFLTDNDWRLSSSPRLLSDLRRIKDVGCLTGVSKE